MRHYRALFSSILLVSLLLLTGCGDICRLIGICPKPSLEAPYAAPFDPEAITVDPETGVEIVSNQVIVKFKEGVGKSTAEAVIAELDCVVVGEIPLLNVYQLKIPDNAYPTDLVAQFENNPHVQWAQVNHIIRVEMPLEIPSEPDFPRQWALHNTGQTGGRVDADIDAPEAWEIEKGHPNVTIAILDTGVNYRHEDLKDNLRMPSGIVFDFIDNDTDPMDEGDPKQHGYGHGTSMAGIAVASMNGKGIVGVAPHATFLPVRVIDQGDRTEAVGEEFALTTGMLFAHTKGKVKIMNMSLNFPEETYLLKEAIAAITSKDDVLLIAAAGNWRPEYQEWPIRLFPAAFPEVMAVAATLYDDRKAPYSNYGDWIDISAPGGSWETEGIWSTDLPDDDGKPPYIDSYGYTGGTSAATAFVSGVAALIWSLDYRTDGDFDLSASDVRTIIKESADPIDDLNPGFEGKLGAGRVNAYKALVEAAKRLGINLPPVATITSPPDGSTFNVGETIHFDGSESYDPDGQIISYTWDFGDGTVKEFGTNGVIVDHVYTDAGSYTVTLTVIDNNQATNTDTIVVDIGNIAPLAETSSIWPSWSPDGSKIAFMSGNGAIIYNGRELHVKSNLGIYTVNADGSNLRNLTSHSSFDIFPSWSPDGKKIAFVSFRDGNGEIYVMNADGSNQHNLTNRPDIQALFPCWSPDGTKIAFVGCDIPNVTIEGDITVSQVADYACNIYIMNTNGSNLHSLNELVNDPSVNWFLSWSPDGSQIAFVSLRDGNAEIYVANTDGSNQHNITNNPTTDMLPIWSPDGKKIAFISFRDEDKRPEIYVMNVDGSDQHKLTNHSWVIPDGEFTMFPFPFAWSPDSEKIIFNSARDGNSEIYVVNIDGSNLRNLTTHPADDGIWFSPWSPDGAKIVFTSNRDGKWEIYTMNADGSDQRKLIK